MKFSRRILLSLLLSLVGFGVSLYQTWHFFALRSGDLGFKSFCNLGEVANCEIIESSKYAELLPGIPLSAAAAGWYLLLIVATGTLFAIVRQTHAYAPSENGTAAKWLRVATLFSGVSVIFSCVYLYFMLAMVKAVCVLCLSIDAVNVLTFAILLSLRPFKTELGFGAFFRTALTCVLVALFAGFVIAKGMSGGPQVSKNERQDWIESVLINSKPVSLNLEGKLAIGDANAPVTIVKFSDFQCPHCQRGAFTLHPVLAARRGKVRLVFRNFPLDGSCNRVINASMHPAACEAARAAYCAGEQGRFDVAYEKIFANQSSLAPGKIASFFEGTSIDVGRLTACMDSAAAKEGVASDIEEGIKLSIQSTPTFFINGRKIEGVLPPDLWIELIDRLASAP